MRLPGLGQNAGYIVLVIATRCSAAGVQEWLRHAGVRESWIGPARDDAAAG
jgi:hypothetical protein